MLFILFLTGVFLFIVGSIMDSHEKAERERARLERARSRR